jgi:CheY-like chemotaxis protein
MPKAGPLILIVDDNHDAREMYGMYLEHEDSAGPRPSTASTPSRRRTSKSPP